MHGGHAACLGWHGRQGAATLQEDLGGTWLEGGRQQLSERRRSVNARSIRETGIDNIRCQSPRRQLYDRRIRASRTGHGHGWITHSCGSCFSWS